ncbi:MAG: hypothetical protein ACK55Z_31520 [bacterium]
MASGSMSARYSWCRLNTFARKPRPATKSTSCTAICRRRRNWNGRRRR